MERMALGKVSHKAAHSFVGWVTCESYQELAERLNELIEGSVSGDPIAFMRTTGKVHSSMVKSEKFKEVGALFFSEPVGDDLANDCYEALLNEYFPEAA